MYGQHPWYRGYPSNVSYNPYMQPSYQSPRNSYPYAFDEDRARALAEQRARKAQYLPDEVDDDEDDYWGPTQLGPRERAYLEARRRQEMMERRKREEEEEARKRALEEQQWQKALEERQREDQEVRQRLLEERKRQLRLKREEEERRIAAEKEKRQQQKQAKRHRDRSKSNASQRQRAQNDRPQSPTHEGTNSIPIHTHRNSQSYPTPSSPSKTSVPLAEADSPRTEASSRPSTPRSAPARSPSPISKHSLEEQNEAASRIQKQYRIHASIRSLDNLASEFETLKTNFVYPTRIDFQKPESDAGHITVGAYRPPSDFDNEDDLQPMDVDGPEGKLDYTSTNYALNSYMDSMDKLLMRLDGVESWGQKEIRSKRRNIVKSIEKEASKVERYWKQAWVDYLVKQASTTKSGPVHIPITSSQPQPSVTVSEESEQSMEE